jgi:hypothetical protein
MMAGTDFEKLIGSGEKYALIGLSVKLEKDIGTKQLSETVWCVSGQAFPLEDVWKGWLGSIRTEDVQESNFFFLAKAHSTKPEVLDEENQILMKAVWDFYRGLLLASTFAPAHKPIFLTGARTKSGIDVRQVQDIEQSVPSVSCPYPVIIETDIALASKLGSQLADLSHANVPGGKWRFWRTLDLYFDTRAKTDLVERLHQYARCVDGLILPTVGESKRQFKSKTELFIGPKHHQLMDEIYDIRSADEHLHENKYLEPFDRDVRLDLVKKEAVIEFVARSSVAKIVERSDLWPHFANTTALAKFWGLDSGERRKIWGDPIDPLLALREFDPQYINDASLGKE